jgi:hypothetical protein
VRNPIHRLSIIDANTKSISFDGFGVGLIGGGEIHNCKMLNNLED